MGLGRPGLTRGQLVPQAPSELQTRQLAFSADYLVVSGQPIGCAPCPERLKRRLRARLHHGPLSHQVIALAATGQLDMAAAGQIRLAVVNDLAVIAALHLRHNGHRSPRQAGMS